MPYVYPIPNLLPPELVTEIRNRLASEPDSWVDGAQTAGRDAPKKNNRELASDSALRVQISDAITTVLRDYQRRESLLFTFLAAPAKIGKFLVSSTETGGGYNDHMDNNVMAKGTSEELRSDMSMTIFLSDPESYQGGELVVDSDMTFAPSFKMPAGGAVLYATNSIHRVNPVTSGTRDVAVTWIQSEIADPFMRQMNADLLQCLNAVSQNAEQMPQLANFLTLKLEKVRGNLQTGGRQTFRFFLVLTYVPSSFCTRSTTSSFWAVRGVLPALPCAVSFSFCLRAASSRPTSLKPYQIAATTATSTRIF